MVGQIVDKAFRVANLLKRPLEDPLFTQREVLSQLMIKSQHTAFGIHHRFSSILYGDNLIEDFRNSVPIVDYDKIFEE